MALPFSMPSAAFAVPTWFNPEQPDLDSGPVQVCKTYMKWIRSQACCVTVATGVRQPSHTTAHHIHTRGLKCPDFWTIPLDYERHVGGPNVQYPYHDTPPEKFRQLNNLPDYNGVALYYLGRYIQSVAARKAEARPDWDERDSDEFMLTEREYNSALYYFHLLREEISDADPN